MSLTINYKQAKALCEFLAANQFIEDESLDDCEAFVVRSDSFPKFKGPKGLYVYDPEYPGEGLIYLG